MAATLYVLAVLVGAVHVAVEWLTVSGGVVDGLIVAWQLPCDHVALAVVLRWLALPVLCAQVDNLHNLVDEDYDFFLKALSRVSELANAADRVDDLDLLAGDRQVHADVCLCK